MPTPDTKETITDGNLALAASDSDDVIAFIGYAIGGAANEVIEFSDPDSVKETLIGGAAAEAMAAILEHAGGRALFVKPTTTPEGAMVITVPGASPAITSSGAPADAYNVKLEITKAGTLGVSTFKVSFDGGDTYSGEIATAASVATFAATRGITFLFAAGTYVLADVYTGTTVGPSYDVAGFNAAFDVLKADPRDWSYIYAVGAFAGASDTLKAAAAATFASNLQTKLEAAKTSEHIFARGIIEGPAIANDATADGLLITAMSSLALPRVRIAGDFAEVRSPISSAVFTRSIAVPYVARIKKASISDDPAYVLEGKLMDSVISIRRDEAKRSGFNDGRIISARTFRKKTGYYITKGKTLAAPGSDFELEQHGRIMDKLCRTVRDVMLPKLNGKQRVNNGRTGVIGTIHETAARAIEQDLSTAINRDLITPGHLVDFEVMVIRTDNIITTKKLRVKVNGLPFAYPEQIEEILGFAAQAAAPANVAA